MTEPTQEIEWSRGLPLMAGPYFLGLFQPSPETKDYWDGVAQRQLRLKRCTGCGRWHHPKRIVCTDCGTTDLASAPACGRGEVYSFSDVHRAAIEAFAASTPYTVGIVRLEEGVHLFTRFISPTPIAIGARVRVDFRELETGRLLPVFITETK